MGEKNLKQNILKKVKVDIQAKNVAEAETAAGSPTIPGPAALLMGPFATTAGKLYLTASLQ